MQLTHRKKLGHVADAQYEEEPAVFMREERSRVLEVLVLSQLACCHKGESNQNCPGGKKLSKRMLTAKLFCWSIPGRAIARLF